MQLNQYTWNPEKDSIGMGSHAEVFKAQNVELDEAVALKVFKNPLEGRASGPGEQAKQEYELHRRLRHPAVLTCKEILYWYAEDQFKRFQRYPVLVLDYANQGTLKQFVIENNDSELLTDLLRQLIGGVQYLHGQDVVHADLKPQNILISKVGDTYQVKITDFGTAFQTFHGTVIRGEHKLRGTLHYMPPERVGTKWAEPVFHKKADIWSLSVLIYELLTDNLPFTQGSSDLKLIENSILNDSPDLSMIQPELKDLLGRGLSKSQQERPGIEEFSAVFGNLKKLIRPDKPSIYEKALAYWSEQEREIYNRIESSLTQLEGHKEGLAYKKRLTGRYSDTLSLASFIWQIDLLHEPDEACYLLRAERGKFIIEHSTNTSGPQISFGMVHQSSFLWEAELTTALEYVMNTFEPNRFFYT